MKSWKKQLSDLKTALRDLKISKEQGKKPANPNLDLPASRLADAHSTAKEDGVSEQELNHLPVTPQVPSGLQNEIQHRGDAEAGSILTQLDYVKATISLSPQSSALPVTTAPPIFRPRFESECFLNMPEWSDVGRSLQHPDFVDNNLKLMTVRIGVDFGTAFTKVAIRAGFDVVPVEWSHVTGDYSEMGRLVAPCFIVLSPDGEYCWRRLTQCETLGNLKLSAIDKAGSGECPITAVAYLALVIRYARAFLYRHSDIGRKLASRSLRWELNIGCPTEPHEKPEVVKLFQRIAQAAWKLSTQEHLYIADITDAWNTCEKGIGLETEPVVIPEFVAQIAGYLRSSQVKDGLHALIDIGAATLDVACFNVVTPKDEASPPTIPIFFSAVRPLGTHYLRNNRYSHLNIDPCWDDSAPVESADEFGRKCDKLLTDVEKVDNAFLKKIARCIFGVIDGTRTNSRGDPRSRAWSDGLPIFITGGGANCDLYRHAIDIVQRDLKQRIEQRLDSTRQFRFITLSSMPENPLQYRMADRLTVALGLTEDAENIARIVPHCDIEPISQGSKKPVDHTDLYGDR